METMSRPYQGSPPVVIIWCVYINPLLLHIENKSALKDKQQKIIGKMQPFGYMDDISNATSLKYNYTYNLYQNQKQVKIPKHILQRMVKLKQNTINTITYHSSMNNIPQNEDKTHTITNDEYGHNANSGAQHNQSPSTLIDEWINTASSNDNHNNSLNTNKTNTSYNDYRNADFYVYNKKQRKDKTIVMLSAHFDNDWTFRT